MCDLLFKQILLIEEENDGRLCEPFIVADAVKELHAFMHPVLERGREQAHKGADTGREDLCI